MPLIKCPSCLNDDKKKIMKSSEVKGRLKGEGKYRYLCKNCGKRFIADFVKKLHNNKVTTDTSDYICRLYLNGHSSRDISRKIYKKFGLRFHYSTVLAHIKRVGILKPSIKHGVSDDRQSVKKTYLDNLDKLKMRLVFLMNRKELYGLSLKKVTQEIEDIDKEINRQIFYLDTINEEDHAREMLQQKEKKMIKKIKLKQKENKIS